MHIKTSDQEALQLGIGNYSCNWGVHMCGLYESSQERDEIIFGFLRQGCLDGDLQLYCPVERTREEFSREFTEFCPECRANLTDPDHFSVLSARDLYYPHGVFDPKHMDSALDEYFQDSQARGRRNIRATAEMVWALEAIPGTEHLMAYESRLNYFIPGKPWLSICMYDINRFSGSMVMQVLQTHPFTINGGVITQNPFFIHPDRWLAEHAPQFL
jgi:hypothetical protein